MRPRSCAFTLLEAVVALALLGAVAVASLNVRAASVAASVRIKARLAAAHAADATLRMAQAGALFPPASEEAASFSENNDDNARVARWQGEVAGVQCAAERQVVLVKQPTIDQQAARSTQAQDQREPSSIVALRYVARCDGEVAAIVLPAL